MKNLRILLLMILVITNLQMHAGSAKAVSAVGKLNSYFILTYPKGGEDIKSDSLLIQWSTLLTTGNVNLSYSINSGLNWNSIVKNINVLLLQYKWGLPIINTPSVRIKLSLSSDTTICSITELDFHVMTKKVIAKFGFYPKDIKVGDEIQFTDSSEAYNTTITGWKWDFNNDGVIDSELENPTFAYSQTGTYTVRLTVSDGTVSDTKIRTDYIVVNTPQSITANFGATPLTGNAPLQVQFSDSSKAVNTTITSWKWDFNNDGVIDSEVQNPTYTYSQAGKYSVKLTVSDGSLTTSSERIAYINVESISIFVEVLNTQFDVIDRASSSWGDYDNDNDYDLLYSGSFSNQDVTYLYKNLGNQTFSKITPFNIGTIDGVTKWIDQDNDGKLDISLFGSIAKIFSNSGSSFVEDPLKSFDVEYYYGSADWGDYDNDGLSDLLYTCSKNSILFKNNKNSFSYQNSLIPFPVSISDIKWCDYDSDGDLDFAVSGNLPISNQNISKIYENKGDGVFNELQGINLPQVNKSILAWGDYDNDGDFDLLIAGWLPATFVTKLYKNNGSNSFVEISTPQFPSITAGEVSWGDLNNDGFLDIITAGPALNGSGCRIFINDKNGSFYEVENNLLPEVEDATVSLADFDNDCDLDLFFSGKSNGTNLIKFLKNKTTQNKVYPASPSNLNSVNFDHYIELTWIDNLNLGELPNTHTYNIRVGTTPGGVDIVSPMSDVATGFRKIVGFGNIFKSKSYKIFGLKPGRYYWSVQSIDNSFKGSEFAQERTFEVVAPTVSKDINLASGWNILSMPLLTVDMSKSSLFPEATSDLFEFDNGYKQVNEFTTGKGYWLRYGQQFNKSITGTDEGKIQIPVKAGWNIIGVYSSPWDVNKIISEPSGIITSDFWGFNNGYVKAATLEVGKGYWVRTSGVGNLLLNPSLSGLAKSSTEESINEVGRIIIKDNLGRSSTLMVGSQFKNSELPPIPPTGIFDVRWSNNQSVIQLTSSNDVIISSAEYPITIRVDGFDARIKDKVGGVIINKVIKNGQSLTITNSLLDNLEICKEEIPLAFELYQNFPNPFNPSTIIKYRIPEAGKVTLKIFDVLGREVEMLVNDYKEAGEYSALFTLHSSFSAGVYFSELKFAGKILIKKMLLIK